MTSQTQSQINNGFAIRIKLSVVGFILQTLVLISTIVWSFATQREEQRQMREELVAIKAEIAKDRLEHQSYVLTNVWSERNKFIDLQLTAINNKLDSMLAVYHLGSEKK